MIRNNFAAVGLIALGLLSGCAQQGTTIRLAKDFKPEVLEKRVKNADKKYEEAIEYFKNDLEIIRPFYKKESLTDAEEAQFKKLLKKEIMKKHTDAKDNRSWALSLFDPFGNSSYDIHFPYLYYESRLNGNIDMLERAERTLPSDISIAENIHSLVKRLGYIKEKVADFFVDEFIQERRSYQINQNALCR
jgi:hypothetical protein